MAMAEFIRRVELDKSGKERTPDSVSINQLVREMYFRKGYDKAPLSKEEMIARCYTGGFNALNTSWESFQIGNDGVLRGTLAPTRFMLSKAVQDISKESGDEVGGSVSIRMAHVSMLLPAMRNGKPVLIGQKKGTKKEMLGAGQIHAGATAGNVAAKYLEAENPLLAALRGEMNRNLALDLSLLNHSDLCFCVHEPEIGLVNVGAVAKRVQVEDVVSAYLRSISGEPLQNLEVRGLALIPIEDAGSIVNGLEVFEPNGNGGGEWKFVEQPVLRPYTKAIIDLLGDKANQGRLIKLAGL